jgi:hypothetical protein
MRRELAGALLALAAAALAVAPGSAPPPLPSAPTGWQLAGPPRLYTGRELYGHINGGAELFHEFGFVDLLVASYADSAGRTVDLECYRLEDARAAHAVYLLKCGAETPLAALARRHSASPFQLTLVAGEVFIQVNNPGGDAGRLPAMAALADALAGERAAPGADSLLARLPRGGLRPGSERLLRGAFGTETYLPFAGGDALALGDRVYAALGEYGQAEPPERLFIAAYPNGATAQAALAALAATCRRDATLQDSDDRSLHFQDYAGRYGHAWLRGDTLRLWVGLAALPGEAP